MIDPIALANMRHWIIDKKENNKKKLSEWQIAATFVGIFISVVVAIGLFFISKPLAISALILFGLSLIIPLLIPSVPLSKEDLTVLKTTERYKDAIIDAISEMNVGINSISLPESILDENVKIRITIGGAASEISMREVDGEIKFFHNGEPIIPNPHVHGPYDNLAFCAMCMALN
jgi:hypothetical protein